MTKKAHLVGAVLTSAGLLAAGSPAYADSVDNDGINIGNDNNIELLPVQLCGNQIAIVGVVAPLLSPQSTECVQAPITDHPRTPPGDTNEPGQQVPDQPAPELPGVPSDNHGDQEIPGSTPGKVVIPAGQSEDLPQAPAPNPVQGHHAVTG